MAKHERDYSKSIRISNLNESTTFTDFRDLIKTFGPTKKTWLAQVKETGLCKGFGYVDFKFKKQAIEAISVLNGQSFNDLTLTVDWSRPPTNEIQINM